MNRSKVTKILYVCLRGGKAPYTKKIFFIALLLSTMLSIQWTKLNAQSGWCSTAPVPPTGNQSTQTQTNNGPYVLRHYPNPAHEEIIFERLDSASSNERFPFLTILNSMGQKVTARSLVNNVTRLSLNTEGLKSGLYYFTLTSGEKIIQSGKFIVK